MTDDSAKPPTTPKKRRKRKLRPGIRENGQQIQQIGTPRPIDVHVGRRVWLRRTFLGMSQETLGEAVGLTFPQIQKYERGATRIGASRLHEFSEILNVPVSFFFDDIPQVIRDAEDACRKGIGSDPAPAKGETALGFDPFARKETVELVRAYYRIKDAAVRKRVFELAKTIGDNDSESESGEG